MKSQFQKFGDFDKHRAPISECFYKLLVILMDLYDYELELQSEIVRWKCCSNVDCLMKFIPKPRHIKLGMSGLVWSIQVLPLHGLTDYTFNIMQVKRSRTPLALSEASTKADLPPKFKVLLPGLEMSMKSAFRAEEALDKLYSFSSLFLRAEEDKRWWIIVDSAITAVGCKTAREATHQAAQAAAAFLVENVEPPALENRQKKSICSGRSGWWIDQWTEPPALENMQKKSISCGRSGWWIENWTAADELWTTSFFSRQIVDDDAMRRQFQARAVEEGNVLQWCAVQGSERLTPCFNFEVAVEEFLEGDDAILQIGVGNHRALKVQVLLTEDVRVDCCQEGLETATSLGLGYLLPYLVRDYIKAALERNEAAAEQSNNNVVEGLLRHVVGYLAFLRRVCLVCGSDSRFGVPMSSTCGDICRACKQSYEDVVAGKMKMKISEEEDSKSARKRREQYVRRLYSNTVEGRTGLAILLRKCVVEKKLEMDGFKKAAYLAGLDKKKQKEMQKSTILYEEAARRVAGMQSTTIASALGMEIWGRDVYSASP